MKITLKVTWACNHLFSNVVFKQLGELHESCEFCKKGFFNFRRILKLTPTHAMMRSIRRRGVNLKSLRALELFGGRGDQTTRDYAPYVGQLEIWEIDPDCETALRKAFPNATIRITDSYEEIRKTSQKFDLVIADPWPRVFGDHCEHFELFPDIFRILSSPSVLVLNVVPEIQKLTAEHARERCAFYQVKDPTKIPLKVMWRDIGLWLWKTDFRSDGGFTKIVTSYTRFGASDLKNAWGFLS